MMLVQAVYRGDYSAHVRKYFSTELRGSWTSMLTFLAQYSPPPTIPVPSTGRSDDPVAVAGLAIIFILFMAVLAVLLAGFLRAARFFGMRGEGVEVICFAAAFVGAAVVLYASWGRILPFLITAANGVSNVMLTIFTLLFVFFVLGLIVSGIGALLRDADTRNAIGLLVVTAAAAFFVHQQISWGFWQSVGAGFGVAIIVRAGSAAIFELFRAIAKRLRER